MLGPPPPPTPSPVDAANFTLPDTAVRLMSPEGVEVILLGTAHVRTESANEVRAIIEAVRPGVVFVELCREREAILHMDLEAERAPATPLTFANMRKALAAPEGGGILGVMKLLVSNVLEQASEQLGADVLPGAEFAMAAQAGSRYGALVYLGDRSLKTTLKRAWYALTVWERCYLGWSLMTEEFSELTEELLEEIVHSGDFVTTAMSQMAEMLPNLSEPLIHERDRYLTHNLRTCCQVLQQRHEAFLSGAVPSDGVSRSLVDGPGCMTVLAVVGLGHRQGIVDRFNQPLDPEDFKNISQLPPPTSWTFAIVKYIVVPIGLTTAVAYGLRRGYVTYCR